MDKESQAMLGEGRVLNGRRSVCIHPSFAAATRKLVRFGGKFRDRGTIPRTWDHLGRIPFAPHRPAHKRTSFLATALRIRLFSQ